ncbi:hypothetical protein E4U43_007122 [Claviceps pusilla]|uniref:Glycosyltransferase family 25 protein n=1 Tax=Claviceps pusilla TaxID=123648 RepID=A0A9P7SZC5_9HYPO|nr:hypothetical protein E4U43_007122 [Claviceps pusilla]
MKNEWFSPGMLLSRRALLAVGAAALVLTLFHLRHGVGSTTYVALNAGHGSLGDVLNATLGFGDILVVGLPSRSDRRDGMTLAAALSDMSITFVNGVRGEGVNEKAVPVPENGQHIKGASLGSWRGHMNAIQDLDMVGGGLAADEPSSYPLTSPQNRVVRRNLSSALILEDDVDWDVRIRQQLHDFALSSRALIQPLRRGHPGHPGQPGRFADPTYPHPRDGSAGEASHLDFHSLPRTAEPSLTPYGDSWDVLWLGHCGMSFPFADNPTMAKGRVVRLHDESVPPKKHLWSLNKPFGLVDEYPAHTRVVHHAQEGVCSLAYAVSRRGARAMLGELALKPATDGFDILLRFFCEGTGGRAKHECLTVNPTLFSHYRPVGPVAASSDIGDHGEGYRREAATDMIRLSTRLNAGVILRGSTDYVDQFAESVPG